MEAKRTSAVPLDALTGGCVELDISIPDAHLSIDYEQEKDESGVTYKAKWGTKPVAMKLCNISASPSEKEIAQFEQETALRFRAGLFSDHVVRVFGMTMRHPRSLVTELMERGNLASLLYANRSKPLDWQRRCGLAIGISTAVADLHTLGIPHNNLSTTTVLLNNQLQPKLMGPRLLASSSKDAVFWRVPKETPPNTVTVLPSSDIYNLGLVLWELATHRKPYIELGSNKVKSPLSHGELEKALDECNCLLDFKQLILDCWSLELPQDIAAYPISEQSSAIQPNPSSLLDSKQETPAPREAKLASSAAVLESKAGLPPTADTERQQVLTLEPEESFQQGGKLYNQGQYHQACSYFQHAATAKHPYPPAYLYLGSMYEHGKGVEKDQEQSAHWYGEAQKRKSWFVKDENTASSNDPAMLFYAGFYYHFAAGGEKDHEAAAKYYERAGKGGNAAAYLNLGNLCRNAKKDKRRYGSAGLCYYQAARAGNALAQLNLGVGYRGGDYGSANDKEAAKWFRAAAEQGHPQAQYYLGLLFNDNPAVKKDPTEEADSWFLRAAEQGHSDAQRILGWLKNTIVEKSQLHLVPRVSASEVVNRLRLIAANLSGSAESKGETPSLPPAIQVKPSLLVAGSSSSSGALLNKVDYNTGRATLDLTPPGLSLGDQLGKGGFGEVYETIWGNKRVAVKQLKLSIKDKSSNKARFEQEAALMLRAGWLSDHIVRLYGVVVEPTLGIVMELMSGGDLATVLHNLRKQGKRLSWDKVCRLASDIAKGVADLHALEILHRDLKSHNILLNDQQQAKVADLGLADVGASRESRKGTSGWMAPEIAQHNAIATKSSDVYSLGMVLWELATYRKPYTKIMLNEGGKILPLSCDELKMALDESDCSAEFKQLVLQCLSTNPRQRPTASDVVERVGFILRKPFDMLQSLSPMLEEATLPLQKMKNKSGSQSTSVGQVLELGTLPSQPQPSTMLPVIREQTPFIEDKAFQRGVRLYEKGQGQQALAYFKQAAEAGYPPAYLYLGYIYAYGKGVKKDVKKDVKKSTNWCNKAQEQQDWFFKQAEEKVGSNDGKALFYLGWYYHFAAGSEKSSHKAAAYYQRAWEAGYTAAYVNLGNLYRERGEHAKAVSCYRQAADQEHHHMVAQFNLAVSYYGGQGVAQDYNEAATLFHAAAKQGHKDAQYRFALMCKDELGIKKDPKRAMKWMRYAAEGGHKDAQFLLGEDCFNNQNTTEAAAWFRAAAEQGHAEAQYCLALLCARAGVAKNEGEGDVWLHRAAEQKHLQAQLLLGKRYYNGEGVSQDYTKAANYLSAVLPSYHEDAETLYYLGTLYSKGLGITQNDRQAAVCFERAAQKGHGKAQQQIALCYERGRGVTHDLQQARDWRRRSTSHNSGDSSSCSSPLPKGSLSSLSTSSLSSLSHSPADSKSSSYNSPVLKGNRGMMGIANFFAVREDAEKPGDSSDLLSLADGEQPEEEFTL